MTPREMTEQAQRDGAALERARILGVVATPADAKELATALRAYHDGSEREELRRLLVRLWGPPVSDLGDLAPREAAQDLAGWDGSDDTARRALNPYHPGLRCVCENGNWPDGAECPCDCHGPVPP